MASSGQDHRRSSVLVVACALSVGAVGCGESMRPVEVESPPAPDAETEASNLSTAAKRDRARVMKRVAASEGLTNAVVLGGLAEAETHFAHCWREATWACKGPHSSFCDGPVIAGGADGACSRRQGGLGMFQFDAGTYRDTLRREGREVLSLSGNVRAAVDYVADMVRDSRFIAGVDSRGEAIDWMNGVEIGGNRYGTWLKTVTAYYNGCFPGECGIYHERYNHYDNAHRRIYSVLGASFWESSGGGSNNSGGNVGTRPPEVPGQVGPQGAEIGNNESLELTWEALADVGRYELEVQTRDGAVWNDYYEWEPAAPPFRVWPQIDDTAYRWHVRACSAAGCSDWTPWRRFAVGAASLRSDSGGSTDPDHAGASTDSGRADRTTLASPGGLSPNSSQIRSSSVDLRWNEVAGAGGYVVNMRYWASGAEHWEHYNTWADVGGVTKEVWPVLDGRTYAWRVRACDGSQCAAWSDWAIFHFGGS